MKKLINYADVAQKRCKNKNKTKHNLNWPDIPKKIHKLQTGYDNTKQAEISYFHSGPSQQENFNHNRSKGRAFSIKENRSSVNKNKIMVIS